MYQDHMLFADVLRRVPYSRASIYRLIEDGRFPKPLKLGLRKVAWPRAQIEQWLKDARTEVVESITDRAALALIAQLAAPVAPAYDDLDELLS